MPTVSPPSAPERIARGAGYICVGMGGVWVMLNPPETLGTALGWFVYVWIAFMASALPCGVAALLGRFRNEYVFLPLFTGALIMANSNLWIRVVTEDPDLGTRAWTGTALILTLVARWFTLRRLVRIGEALGKRGHRWTGTTV